MATIINGSSIPLSYQDTSVPAVDGALQNYFQKMTFTTIVKSVVNFQLVETPTNIAFWGVIMPFKGRDLLLKPEGQRAWNWVYLFAQTPIDLKTDDVVSFRNLQYRVMKKKTFTLYSYLEFEMVEDWTGSGPNP